MLLAYLYDKKYQKKIYLAEYKDLARKLISRGDFNRYWLFCYEILPSNELTHNDLQDRYKKLKINNISFIKADFQ